MVRIINKNLFFLVGAVLFLSVTFITPVFASDTYGSIDPTYKYAWSENTGWINFGTSNGDVHVIDSRLSGYALSENVGWIYLGGVLNDSNGNLSGFAWGENIGWIKFDPTNGGVVINSNGVFTGSAYGENVGWITFGTGDNKVVTDWRPLNTRSLIKHRGLLTVTSTPVVPPALVQTNIVVTPPIINLVDSVSPINQLSANITPKIIASPSVCSFCVPTFSNKSKGEPVKELQKFLNKALKLNITVDGKFGPKTLTTIKKWQKANGLKADGIIGPKTREKINTLVF